MCRSRETVCERAVLPDVGAAGSTRGEPRVGAQFEFPVKLEHFWAVLKIFFSPLASFVSERLEITVHLNTRSEID